MKNVTEFLEIATVTVYVVVKLNYEKPYMKDGKEELTRKLTSKKLIPG